MSKSATGRLPGYKECVGSSVAQMQPQIVDHDGETFLVVHSERFSTGVVRPKGTNGEADRTVMTIWGEKTLGAPVALALSFTPDDEMLDLIISSLTKARDRQRETAKALAAAALRKASGK